MSALLAEGPARLTLLWILFAGAPLLLLVACSGSPTADDEAAGDPPASPSTFAVESLSPEGRSAFNALREVEMFTDDAIGVAGITPEWVVAFRRLVKDPEAKAAFAELLRSASPAGRVYGLCGLWSTDSEAFARGLSTLEAEGGTVRTQFGCNVADLPLASVLRSPADRVVRLNGPEDSLESWRRRNEGVSAHYDVAGGAYPALLRDG